jgi:hypothetical protein
MERGLEEELKGEAKRDVLISCGKLGNKGGLASPWSSRGTGLLQFRLLLPEE